MCADTEVGYRIYFFKDKPVAFSYKSAIKNDENIEWISVKAYNKVKKYLQTFIPNEGINHNIIDLNKNFDGYRLQYYNQLNQYNKNNAIFENFKVIVLECVEKSYPEIVKIKFEDESETFCKIKDLLFEFNLIKKIIL